MGVLRKGVAGGLGVLLSVVIAVAAPAASRHTSRHAASTPVTLPTTSSTKTTTPPPTITMDASATHLVGRHQVTLSGTTTNASTGSEIRLWRHRYPYHTDTLSRTTQTQSDGSFNFGAVYPDRDTVYQAVLVGTHAQANVLIHVVGQVKSKITAFPVSKVKVKLVVVHPPDLKWNGA